MGDRVLALYPSAYLESTPCVRNLLECLAEEGWAVELLTLAGPEPLDGPVGVETHRLAVDGGLLNFVRQAHAQIAGRAGEFGSVLAIDRGGLLAASGLKRRAGLTSRRVYMTTEIFIPPVFTGWRNSMANTLEALLARRSGMVISPSRERALEHCRRYGVPEEKAAVLPNSPRGEARGGPRSDELARRLDARPEQAIILYAGSLTAPNRIEELLAEAAADWPEEWILVLNSRVSLTPTERDAMAKWQARARCRIVVLNEPSNGEELHSICRGADVGVALYREDGPTFQTVGTASGKIAQYLMAGLPVVATPLSSVTALVEGTGAGVCARIEKGEVRQAVQRILANPASYRMRAAQCFDEHFHFDRAYRKLSPRLHATLALETSQESSEFRARENWNRERL